MRAAPLLGSYLSRASPELFWIQLPKSFKRNRLLYLEDEGSPDMLVASYMLGTARCLPPASSDPHVSPGAGDIHTGLAEGDQEPKVTAMRAENSFWSVQLENFHPPLYHLLSLLF